MWKKRNTLSLLVLLLALVGLNSPAVMAQETAQENTEETKPAKEKTIEINDILSETEKLGRRIRALREVLSPISEAQEIDSVLNNVYSGINLHRDTLFMVIHELNPRELKLKTAQWSNYHSELKGYQEKTILRLEEINELNSEVVSEIDKWNLTREKISESTEPMEVLTSIDTMLLRLDGVLKLSVVRLDSIFVIQKRLTDVILIVNEVLDEINLAELELQKNYFTIDSPPLWNADKNMGDSLAHASIIHSQSNQQRILEGIKSDYEQLSSFYGKNLKTLLFQVLFVLVLLSLMLAVRRKWIKGIDELSNPLEKEAKRVIANPVSASIAVGLLVSNFFYKTTIPIFTDTIVTIILAATVYLLPKLTHRKITTPLLIILLVYFIHFIDDYIEPYSLFSRLLMLCASALLAYSLYKGRQVMNRWPKRFPRIKMFRNVFVLVFMGLTLLSLAANIIGMVNLARFLGSAVLTSVALGAVVYLTIKVSTSIIILLIKLRHHFNLRTLTDMVVVIQKRVRPVIMWAGILLWILFTLMGFELYEYLQMWVTSILEIEWKVGQMEISLGGLLSFIFIFIVTMFLAKFVATIFQDEWLIKVLPRGIAPAISLLARIFLITIGFYMGLTAAGFDVGKIGILLGALGVGIGFGLQSIVLNFISGLILAFERPINLGDAIEVDQEFGVVTSIGVRASNIRTYEGSEVIIPNGDLVSRKVVNWTLSNRDRRTRTLMKTSSEADPYKVIELFNQIANEHPSVYSEPAPTTHFYGFNQEGNLDFALVYWVSFSDKLSTDSEIALRIYDALKKEGIQAPIPKWKIVGNTNQFND
jgi:small-conductance mechanosensitive channel